MSTTPRKLQRRKDEVNCDEMVKACTQNNVENLRKGLAKVDAARINKPMYGSEYFLIRYAVEKSHTECVKELLEFGADPNVGVDNDYWHYIQPPPLWIAAENGAVEVVDLLIKYGANPFHMINGRKAKTVAKGKEATALCRAAEERIKAEREEAKAKAKAEAAESA